ncbi:unnamed protein product [Ectocarpus sp. 8 AP-2014]
MDSSYRNEGNVVTNNLGMRRSCCECGRKKRKCDGLAPCSRCLGSGVQSTYSKRKPHLPQPQHRHQHHPHDPAGTKSAEFRQRHSSSGTLVACGMLPLKRFRLSASPATGLVGMRENAFLSDFFGCVGFYPLTTQRSRSTPDLREMRWAPTLVLWVPRWLQRGRSWGTCTVSWETRRCFKSAWGLRTPF